MEIFAATKLEAFWEQHAAAKTPLKKWHQIATQARWASIVDVRRIYPSADFTKGNTIFNIGGNKFRLIVVIAYAKGIIRIKEVLTHGEYTRRYC